MMHYYHYERGDVNKKVTIAPIFGLMEDRVIRLHHDVVSHDLFIRFFTRQYFSSLRQEKGHNPAASPIDLEILLLVRFIAVSDGNIIDLLRQVGIVIVEDKIVINGGLLTDALQSSRSRVNNTLNRLKWDVVQLGHQEKYEMLSPLLDRSDLRNWTIRLIPVHAALRDYLAVNPDVRFKGGVGLI